MIAHIPLSLPNISLLFAHVLFNETSIPERGRLTYKLYNNLRICMLFGSKRIIAICDSKGNVQKGVARFMFWKGNEVGTSR